MIEGNGKRKNSQDLGPGGIRCECCGPQCGSMRLNRRQERRLNKQDWQKEVAQELNEFEAEGQYP